MEAGVTRMGLLGPSSLVHLGPEGGDTSCLPSQESKPGLALRIHSSDWGQGAWVNLEHSRKKLELRSGPVVSKLTIESFLQTKA